MEDAKPSSGGLSQGFPLDSSATSSCLRSTVLDGAHCTAHDFEWFKFTRKEKNRIEEKNIRSYLDLGHALGVSSHR